MIDTVDHEEVIGRVVEDSGLSARYLFMTAMSAGIAVLGLLLSSPAVVIGAMLISPLMSPILGVGFGLALFEFNEVRRALTAILLGSLAAVLFTALIVLASPLQATTPRSSRARGPICSTSWWRCLRRWRARLRSSAGAARRSWAWRSPPP